MKYQAFRNSNGEVDAINRVPDGATVPTWDAADPLTIEFREWHQQHPEFDISSHPPQSGRKGEPDWGQFAAQVTMHGAYIRIATHSPKAQYLDSKITALLWRVGEDPAKLTEVANLWSALAYEARPTLLEITALNKLAHACNMPFMLDLTGLMKLHQ